MGRRSYNAGICVGLVDLGLGDNVINGMYGLSGEIGSASKMKIVLNMLMGTMLAGLAESMALAEKIGLNTVEVLNIMSHTVGSSALLRNKGTG